MGGRAPAGHMRRAGAGICTSRGTGANRASGAGWEPRSRVLSKGRSDVTEKGQVTRHGPSRPGPTLKRAVLTAGQPLMAEPDFGTGKNVVLPFPSARAERYRSSGLIDPARPTADRPVSTHIRFPYRPLAVKEIQMILFQPGIRVKTKKSLLFFQLLRIHASRPSSLWISMTTSRNKAESKKLHSHSSANTQATNSTEKLAL